MHPQLETLLEIQDLKTQRVDLLEQSESRDVEEELFNISADEALEQLGKKIEEMAESLEPSVRNRYRRLSGSKGRFVVPVINGTCFGCFVSIPTAVASAAERNEALRFCDNCGRFLYLVG
ncbi:MAG: C4-type zinc ribbon domain-containing protein [Gemmatimonadota bacterium]